MNKKITSELAIGIILILVIIISGIFYLQNKKELQVYEKQNVKNDASILTKQEDETSIKTPIVINTNEADLNKWKTYKNENYGFEIKYPESYYQSTDNVAAKRWNYKKGDVEFGSDDARDASGQHMYGYVFVAVEDNEEELSLNDWANKNINLVDLFKCEYISNEEYIKYNCRSKDDLPDDYRIKPVVINGKEALLISEDSISSNSIILVTFQDKIVKFQWDGELNENDDYSNNFFVKMIGSFRIL